MQEDWDRDRNRGTETEGQRQRDEGQGDRGTGGQGDRGTEGQGRKAGQSIKESKIPFWLCQVTYHLRGVCREKEEEESM